MGRKEISCDTDVRCSWHLASVTLPIRMHALETRLPLSGACCPDLGLCTPDLGHACARRALTWPCGKADQQGPAVSCGGGWHGHRQQHSTCARTAQASAAGPGGLAKQVSAHSRCRARSFLSASCRACKACQSG